MVLQMESEKRYKLA